VSRNVTIDPDATFQEIQTLARRLAELARNLDAWIAAGGTAPSSGEETTIIDAQVRTTTKQPWWQVRSSELARRYGCDADRLRDDINPEDLSEWQFDLVMAAIAFAEERVGRMRIPES
jgi:hypothetical protein